MLILGSLEALQPIQTWSHASARLLNTRVTLLHVYLAIPPVCVHLCGGVYLCTSVPVLLCVPVCTCVYLCCCATVFAASANYSWLTSLLQFSFVMDVKKKTLALSKQLLESQCALQRSHRSAFEAVSQSLGVISHQ